MRNGDSADVINDQAAEWVVRISHANDDPTVVAALADWLSGDTRRQGAYLRASAAWARVADAMDGPRDVPVRPPAIGRRVMLGGAVAAFAATGAAFTWTLWPAGRSYATAVGEQASNRLSDGSVMLLNTNSAGRVTMHHDRRDIELVRGEARFDVAKDKARPFVVAAGAIRVEAVGTVFVVRRREHGADIVITSGRVRIWSVRAPTRFLTLSAGHRVTMSEVGGADNAVVHADGIERGMAWSRGMIALDGMTLAEAASEFNRYGGAEVTVEDDLADQKVVGWFNAHDSQGFARSAAAMVGGRVEREANTIRIVR